jgi:hypothetical protein
MWNQKTEVIDEIISCLGVTIKSTGRRNKHNTKEIIKGNQTSVAIDKSSDMEVKILENVYEMV